MDVLTIALILLIAAAIWLIAEVAVTVRRARGAVGSVHAAVEEARPAIAHIDETVQAIRPAVERIDAAVAEATPAIGGIDPLLSGTTEAVLALSEDLRRLDDILGDVSRISGKAGNATVAVSDAATSLAGRARTLFSREGRRPAPARIPAAGQGAALAGEAAGRAAEQQAQAPEAAEPEVLPQVVTGDAGYFTYPQ